MSSIALLMGLLLLSYLGSLIVGGKQARGLPSGVEYLGLGFAVGPHALGLVNQPMMVDFEPVVQVALGWLAFVVGLDFGRVEGRRVPLRSMTLGIGCAVLTGSLVTLATYQLLGLVHVRGVTADNALLLSAGAGAVTAETARSAASWVVGRWTAKGPVSKLLVEIAASDDFAPLVATGAIFALTPPSGLAFDVPLVSWIFVSVALGGLLGLVTAILLREAQGYQVWGALLGTILLAVGIAARIGLSTIFVTFVMGIALAGVARSRRVLRRLVGPTERAVLYPMLLLAGARIDPRPLFDNRLLVAVIALVLLARIVGKLASGLVVRNLVPAARPAGPGLGIVLLSSGPVSISCGFVFALRFPGVIGDTLLLTAAASALLGELVSTLALQRLLGHLGEIAAPVSRSPSTVPPPPRGASERPPAPEVP